MKKISILVIFIFVSAFTASAQHILLTFSGRDARTNERAPLTEVQIPNLTQGWTIHSPLNYPQDSTIVFAATGIEEYENNGHAMKGIKLLQNNPNPFDGHTEVTLHIEEAGEVMLSLLDAQGRVLEKWENQNLAKGAHLFRVTASVPGLYVLSAYHNGKLSSIKMIHTGNHPHCQIDYAGATATPLLALSPKDAMRDVITDLPFEEGDLMGYRGIYQISNYMIIYGEWVVRNLVDSDYIPLPRQMRSITCPSTPFITDFDGNEYGTVVIGSQCWMKENLRTTHYANGTPISAGVTLSDLDGYYYHAGTLQEDAMYGYYYNWRAVMHGEAASNSNPSEVQGVCPMGWHVPSDVEWQMMEARIGVPASDTAVVGTRGSVAAKIAGDDCWSPSLLEAAPGNPNYFNRNMFGFSALPAGEYTSTPQNRCTDASFWSSTLRNDDAYQRRLFYDSEGISRSTSSIDIGRNVRCVRDLPIDTLPAEFCFESAQILCLDSLNHFSYPARTSAMDAMELVNRGCLNYCPAFSWFVIKIDEPGDIQLSISHSAGRDIDFACWGAFTGYDSSEQFISSMTPDELNDRILIDCHYGASSTEHCHIPNAQAGEWYILFVSNYSRAPGFITISQEGGNGSLGCE